MNWLFGAIMFNVEDLSEKALQFLVQNKDLIREAFDKCHVILRVVEVAGRIKVVLYFDDDTRSQDIRAAVPYAEKLRDELLKFQGPWMGGGPNPWLEQLSSRQENGMSYTKLARMINTDIEKHLREYLAYRKEVDELYPQFEKEFEHDFYYWISTTRFKHSGSGLNKARALLRALAFRDDEIMEILKGMIECIKEGKNPIADNYPIDQRKMIEKLRTWREGKEHRAIRANE